jgi:hypothetical protein
MPVARAGVQGSGSASLGVMGWPRQGASQLPAQQQAQERARHQGRAFQSPAVGSLSALQGPPASLRHRLGLVGGSSSVPGRLAACKPARAPQAWQVPIMMRPLSRPGPGELRSVGVHGQSDPTPKPRPGLVPRPWGRFHGPFPPRAHEGRMLLFDLLCFGKTKASFAHGASLLWCRVSCLDRRGQDG